MPSPEDRHYTETHEWHKLKGGEVTIGISRFAVDEVTDITYLEFNRTEGQITTGESFGELESVKATSELYCGIDGTVTAVNEQLIEDPSIINQDPWEQGWLVKVRPDDETQLGRLLDASAYDAHTGQA